MESHRVVQSWHANRLHDMEINLIKHETNKLLKNMQFYIFIMSIFFLKFTLNKMLSPELRGLSWLKTRAVHVQNFLVRNPGKNFYSAIFIFINLFQVPILITNHHGAEDKFTFSSTLRIWGRHFSSSSSNGPSNWGCALEGVSIIWCPFTFSNGIWHLNQYHLHWNGGQPRSGWGTCFIIRVRNWSNSWNKLRRWHDLLQVETDLCLFTDK